MIINNLQSMDLVTLFGAYVIENRLAILFNTLAIEYIVSIPWHQHNVIGNLAIAMAETMQLQALSHPGLLKLALKQASAKNNLILKNHYPNRSKK
jgi:hypothetical protein